MTNELSGTRPERRTTRIIGAIGVILVIGVLAWTKRHDVAVALAPAKKATTTRSAAAIEADSLFWHTFHGGAYDSLPRALAVLMASYLETRGPSSTCSPPAT